MYETYLTAIHSCPIGCISLCKLKCLQKFYKFNLQTVPEDKFFKKDAWERICCIGTFGTGICWKHGEQKQAREKLRELLLNRRERWWFVNDIYWIFYELVAWLSLSLHIISMVQHGMCICVVFSHSLVCIRNLTRSLYTLIWFLILTNLIPLLR